jgi:hypothetical protein
MRHDVYHYFQQACQRKLPPARPRQWVSQDNAVAGFLLEVGKHGRIETAEYRCTTCMTLVALCEHVAEQLRGATPEQACGFSAVELLRWHPEVPPMRRSRAYLAIAAAHAALEDIRI